MDYFNILTIIFYVYFIIGFTASSGVFYLDIYEEYYKDRDLTGRDYENIFIQHIVLIIWWQPVVYEFLRFLVNKFWIPFYKKHLKNRFHFKQL